VIGRRGCKWAFKGEGCFCNGVGLGGVPSADLVILVRAGHGILEMIGQATFRQQDLRGGAGRFGSDVLASVGTLCRIGGAHAGGGLRVEHARNHAMGEDLRELRFQSAGGNASVMVCTPVGLDIVMMYSFIKGTRKARSAGLALSRQ